MKTIAVIAIIITCLSSARAVDLPGPESAVVQKLDESVPTDKEQYQKWLWDHFANKPDEIQFSGYSTENWQVAYSSFSKALVQKAANANLDSISLEKILEKIKKDSKGRIAYLPVGAYSSYFDKKPAWIITVKWETFKGSHLGHIRMFVFDQKSLKQVAFNTCM
jgi:hypothetical protein